MARWIIPFAPVLSGLVFLSASLGLLAAAQLDQQGPSLRLANAHLAVTLNLTNGNWTLQKPDGTAMVSELAVSWGANPNASTRVGSSEFQFGRCQHASWEGLRLTLERGHQPKVNVEFFLPDEEPCILIKCHSLNTNTSLPSFHLTGKLDLGRTLDQVRLFLNPTEPAIRGITKISKTGLLAPWPAYSRGWTFISPNRTDQGLLFSGIERHPQTVMRIQPELEQGKTWLAFDLQAESRPDPAVVTQNAADLPEVFLGMTPRLQEGLAAWARTIHSAYLDNPGRPTEKSTNSSWPSELSKGSSLRSARWLAERWGQWFYPELASAWSTQSSPAAMDAPTWQANSPPNEQNTLGEFLVLSGLGEAYANRPAQYPLFSFEKDPHTRPDTWRFALPGDLDEVFSGWGPAVPQIWHRKFQLQGATTRVWVGLFNWTSTLSRGKTTWPGQTQNLTLDLRNHLGLDPNRRALVFDLDQREYLGAHQRNLTFGLPPGKRHLLLITPEHDWPQVVGDNLPPDLADNPMNWTVWQPAQQRILGQRDSASQRSCILYVHLPAGWSIKSALAGDRPGTISNPGKHLSRITWMAVHARFIFTINCQPAAVALEPNANPVLSHLLIPQPDPNSPVLRLANLPPLAIPESGDGLDVFPQGPSQADLVAATPARLEWNLEPYSATHPDLEAEALVIEGGPAIIKWQGDGKDLFVSKPVAEGQTIVLKAGVRGVKRLLWRAEATSPTQVRLINPRLSNRP